MELVINNQRKIKCKTAFDIRKVCDKERFKNMTIWSIVVVMLDVFLFCVDLAKGLFVLGFFLFFIIYAVLVSAKIGRRIVSAFHGVSIYLEDNEFKIGNGVFVYSDINSIVIEEEFIIIVIGKIRIPILLVDESREKVSRAIEFIKTKGV